MITPRSRPRLSPGWSRPSPSSLTLAMIGKGFVALSAVSECDRESGLRLHTGVQMLHRHRPIRIRLVENSSP